MKEQEHTTLSVDMSVLAAEDQELADCIIAEYDSCDSILCLSSYYRLAPFLNKAVQSFIDEKAPEYVFSPQSVHRLGQSRCRSKRIFCFLLQLQQPRPPSSPPHRFHRQALMHHRYGHSYNRSPPWTALWCIPMWIVWYTRHGCGAAIQIHRAQDLPQCPLPGQESLADRLGLVQICRLATCSSSREHRRDPSRFDAQKVLFSPPENHHLAWISF